MYETQFCKIEDFMPKAIGSSCSTIAFIIKNNSPLRDEIQGQAKALSEYFNVRQVETLGEIEEGTGI